MNISPKVAIFKGFDSLGSQSPNLGDSEGYSENNW
jgi:hypothetical protein